MLTSSRNSCPPSPSTSSRESGAGQLLLAPSIGNRRTDHPRDAQDADAAVPRAAAPTAAASDPADAGFFEPLLHSPPKSAAELRLYFSDATACPRVPLLRFAHRAVGSYCGETGDRAPLCDCAEVTGEQLSGGALGAVAAHLSAALTSEFTPGPVEHTSAEVFRLFTDVLLVRSPFHPLLAPCLIQRSTVV